jgi:hypothetical protein
LAAILGYLLFGLSIAALQWPVLRHEIPNALVWVTVSVVGWALGAYLGQLVLSLLVASAAASPLLSTTVTVGITGLVAGAVTGLALVWIGRQPDRQARPAARAPG